MFDLVAPCKNCPFRNDIPHQRGWLGSARAQDIFDNLKQGGFFPCHKTTAKDPEEEFDEGGEEYEPKFKLYDHHQYCAGALIMLEKEGIAPTLQPIQVAERLGFYNRGKLRIDNSPIFESGEEFVKWHGNWRDL